MSLCNLSAISDYCGDPSLLATDNTCVNVQRAGNFTRHVGTALEYKCLSLLVNFTSLMDYCPVQTCMNDTYYTGATISCGSKLRINKEGRNDIFRCKYELITSPSLYTTFHVSVIARLYYRKDFVSCEFSIRER